MKSILRFFKEGPKDPMKLEMCGKSSYLTVPSLSISNGGGLLLDNHISTCRLLSDKSRWRALIPEMG